jgi:sphinganine-1-phosphate aldolase
MQQSKAPTARNSQMPPPRALPAQGLHWKALERLLAQRQIADTDWEHGAFGLWWPHQPSAVYLAAAEAAARYAHSNSLFAGDMPGLHQIQQELQAIVAELLRAPKAAHVTFTAGGTESNLLAVKSARNWARATRALRERPEIIIPYTGHPSFDKSAELMDIDIRRIPVAADYRADVEQLANAISARTIMIVASAPSYTHGVIDPVAELADIASEKKVWLHVDACVGGFLHPFLRRLGEQLADFDFTIAGVHSISADLHKYGYAPTGISSLTLRNEQLLQYQRYEMHAWPRGRYSTTGILGSRPGGSLAAAWATMMSLGEDGYLQIADTIRTHAMQMREAISTIDGISPVGPTNIGIFPIQGSDGVPVPALVEALRQRGRPTYWSEDPPALHLLLDPVPTQLINDYLLDLAAAVDDVRQGRVTARETEATYATN